MFAGQVAAVEEVPQFGALAAGVPAAEFVAQGQDPFLCPSFVLVAAGAAEDGVELPAGDGVEQRLGLQGVPGPVGAFAQATVVDVALDLRHREVKAVLLGGLVTEADDLVEVVSGVDVEKSERNLRRPERLRREVEDRHGVLAAGEQQHGTFELGGDLTDDVDRFGFEDVEGGQARTRVVGGRAASGAVWVSLLNWCRCSCVKSAFCFGRSGPTAGAGVFPFGDGTSAGLAADRRVPLVKQRVDRDVEGA